MPKQGKVTISLDKLKSLYESLKTKPSIEVGVFSAKDGRDDSMTNATLAFIHEMGSPEHGLPPRSMLKVPLKDHINEIMAVAKGHGEEIVLQSGALRLWKLLGVAAEKVVIQAFQTGGFGKWAPLKYGTLLAKFSGSLKKRKGIIAKIYAGVAGAGILIRTRQLSRSFSSRVRMHV